MNEIIYTSYCPYCGLVITSPSQWKWHTCCNKTINDDAELRKIIEEDLEVFADAWRRLAK